jgi:hypothetical protein
MTGWAKPTIATDYAKASSVKESYGCQSAQLHSIYFPQRDNPDSYRDRSSIKDCT